MEALEFEKKQLKSTLQALTETRGVLKIKLQNLDNAIIDKELIVTLKYAYARQIYDIDKHIDSPYFAKLIYKDDLEDNVENLYIGKAGMFDKDGKQLVVDWRAPISTLYYDSEIGRVEYLTPEGQRRGDLSLKRQINIEDGKILNVIDGDMLTNDELLKPYLEQKTEKRLKSIVATIQQEQNKIIRAPIKNIVVQGVAGSGKTTVALHRLSYLIYQMKKFDTTADFLIIGPNRVFLKYISDILPDLETEDATQLTFEELALNVVDEKFKVSDKNHAATGAGYNKKDKTTLKYKNLLDEFLLNEEKNFLPENVNFYGIEMFDKTELYNLYCLAKKESVEDSLNNLIATLTGKFTNPNLQEDFLDKVKIESAKRGIDVPLNDLWNLKKGFEKGKPEFFKKQLKFRKVSIISIYQKFLKFIENMDEYKTLAKETLDKLKSKEVEFEDLAALIYLKQKLSQSQKYQHICHVVIDEAQDFGVLHFIAIKNLFKNCVFDLYGDLNQAIYSNCSIEKWEDIFEQFKDRQYFELKKSYRTTIEVMDCANIVASHSNLILGQPVIRHGDEVILFEAKDEKAHQKLLIQNAEELSQKFATTAIICKSEEECLKVSKVLKGAGIKHSLFDEKQKISGIIVLTIHQAKGLEFDCVILNDCSKNNFDTNKLIDMKLLYVGLTRAMHKLVLLSNGDAIDMFKEYKREEV